MKTYKLYIHRCPSCKRDIVSDISKKWYKYWCESTGKDVRMQLIKPKKK
jgi:hypothetical protein